VAGNARKILWSSEQSGVQVDRIRPLSTSGTFIGIGESSSHPGEVVRLNEGNPERLTDVNPWLSDRSLGEQRVIRWNARDDLAIEGLLVLPVDYRQGTSSPLIVVVHGGPESHFSNGWLTNHTAPAQVLAGKGYAVFFPNYRSSTGYGPAFSGMGFGDPAGKEFDDIADGIDFLVNEGIADKGRVGLGGGSYGGFASAWFATYYTRYVRAVCMSVGVSNLISMAGTTDIPWEHVYVHWGKKLNEMWDHALQRSPVYYAHQSKTATLIMGGTNDTRVSPTQSLELFRIMKMNGHPAVRMVQYPGEGHGNSRQPARIDQLYRTIEWYDWYVRDAKPLDGPMPPVDISARYGVL
jgi:dipeptidyl aminopeptidase/acylaminoacyl peptidase